LLPGGEFGGGRERKKEGPVGNREGWNSYASCRGSCHPLLGKKRGGGEGNWEEGRGKRAEKGRPDWYSKKKDHVLEQGGAELLFHLR